MLALVPNPAAGVWASRYDVPAFFTDGAYRTCLDPDETVLPLPIGAGSESMLWQVGDGFRFRMAGGQHRARAPRAFLSPPVPVHRQGGSLTGGQVPGARGLRPRQGRDEHHRRPEHDHEWSGALDRIATPVPLGGVVVYHVADGSPSCLGAA